MDVSKRLIKINKALALEVRNILEENKAERHIRGGMATKLKYSNERKIRINTKNGAGKTAPLKIFIDKN